MTDKSAAGLPSNTPMICLLKGFIGGIPITTTSSTFTRKVTVPRPFKGCVNIRRMTPLTQCCSQDSN